MKKEKTKNKHNKTKNIEEIAERANRGEDVSPYFTGDHVAKQRVNVDFPLDSVKIIDQECRRLGITRQSWIKIACDEKISHRYAVSMK